MGSRGAVITIFILFAVPRSTGAMLMTKTPGSPMDPERDGWFENAAMGVRARGNRRPLFRGSGESGFKR